MKNKKLERKTTSKLSTASKKRNFGLKATKHKQKPKRQSINKNQYLKKQHPVIAPAK